MKHAGGRPTDYTPEILEQAKSYLSVIFGDPSDTKEPRVPSIAGFARLLSVSRSTVYEWAKEHKEFSDILEEVLALQEQLLLHNGLNSKWNPTITKLMLSKHGYRESTDVTSGDKPISPLLVRFLGDAPDTGNTEGV